MEIEEQKEKIKLIKNSKGFNWELSLLGKPEENLDRLKEINSKMEETYDKTYTKSGD